MRLAVLIFRKAKKVSKYRFVWVFYMQMTSEHQLEPALNVSRSQVKTKSKFLRLSKKNVNLLPSKSCIYHSPSLKLDRMFIDQLISKPSKKSVNNSVMHFSN